MLLPAAGSAAAAAPTVSLAPPPAQAVITNDAAAATAAKVWRRVIMAVSLSCGGGPGGVRRSPERIPMRWVGV